MTPSTSTTGAVFRKDWATQWVAVATLLLSFASAVIGVWNWHELQAKEEHKTRHGAIEVGRVYAELLLYREAEPKSADDAWLHRELQKEQPLLKTVGIDLIPSAYSSSDLPTNKENNLAQIIAFALNAQFDDDTLVSAFDAGESLELVSGTVGTQTPDDKKRYSERRAAAIDAVAKTARNCVAEALPTNPASVTEIKSAIAPIEACVFQASKS